MFSLNGANNGVDFFCSFSDLSNLKNDSESGKATVAILQ